MSMHDVFFYCAAVGGGLLVIQTILMFFGADGEGDFSEFEADEAGAGGNAFLGFLSVKTVVAFLTFFGLGGWAAEEAGLAQLWQVCIAGGAGSVAFYIVGLLMVLIYRLESKGNVDLAEAVGQVAAVYLVIPGGRKGMGKITVTLKSQSLEIDAVTDGEEIRTGQQVKVVGMSGPETFEVALM